MSINKVPELEHRIECIVVVDLCTEHTRVQFSVAKSGSAKMSLVCGRPLGPSAEFSTIHRSELKSRAFILKCNQCNKTKIAMHESPIFCIGWAFSKGLNSEKEWEKVKRSGRSTAFHRKLSSILVYKRVAAMIVPSKLYQYHYRFKQSTLSTSKKYWCITWSLSS